jgi:8-oxo-dGTP pyrophosphatase MutT (NUDIX family)
MRFHDFVNAAQGWITHVREVLFSNPFVEIHRVQMSSPMRKSAFEWTVCHRKPGVCVAAQTPDGGFVMIRQERVPIQDSLWEFPAGQIDQSGFHDWQAICETGLRELREEAGYEPVSGADLVSLQHFFTSAGFTDEHCHLIWVRGVHPSPLGAHHDPGEAISDVRVFSSQDLRMMVARGEVRDANTLCCLARLAAIGAWGEADCSNAK